MNLYSVAGLALDFVGVMFLGVDLVRFQLAIRKRAKKSEALFVEIESWANDHHGTVAMDSVKRIFSASL